MSNVEKTNVMRILEQKKIPCKSHFYGDTDAVNGEDVAKALGEDPDRVFKTLVTRAGGNCYVFMVPVNRELDLKKAAKAVGVKSVEMLKQSDLLPTTGYVHGGCSPIGMKKQFKTVAHISASEFETIIFSGGKIGFQVEMPLSDLQKVIRVELADICRD